MKQQQLITQLQGAYENTGDNPYEIENVQDGNHTDLQNQLKYFDL